MKLIIGLGNPGKNYDLTRHNIGFMVIDSYLAESLSLKNITWQKKFNALYYERNISNEKVLFIKPQTYMNLSGNSIEKFINYYKVNLKDILIIHDDLDLPIGKYRIKVNSSDGGHNGIKSIIESLKDNAFARLKIGISKDNQINTKNYVLSTFTKNELEIINSNNKTYFNIINDFIIHDIKKLMNDYNRKNN